MNHHFKSVGFFVALVCSTLLIVAWPRPAAPESAPPSLDAAPRPDWTVSAGWWGSEQHGLRLIAPPGWTETRRQGRDYLDRVAHSPRDGNLCLIAIPNMLGLQFDQLVEQNQQVFDTTPGLDAIELTRGELDGHDVLWTEYLATQVDSGKSYHCRGIVLLRGSDQIVLTLTIAADQWDAVSETAVTVFESIELRPGSEAVTAWGVVDGPR